ncbi:molecular chaperone DnaK [Halanaerobium saccharolyticum]|uniref:Chaperone protein DnaK n=1 Tax=Halanaerobium saccharolyticum TaxID=43595 RepID=A0A4R6LZ30_9FIRM|nr:Hsp70 family protein [Halanaerobium saccharolyticum]TDO94063.1 molecular chaperone DnaK [Halanaerobium saccharolyticum]
MTKDRFRPVVGIDLGTTNSSLAAIIEGEATVITLLKESSPLLPSVVHIDQVGEVIVGGDAKSALVAMPERTIAEVKRKMGENEMLEIADQKLLPEEISALILKELKKYVDQIYGEEVEKEAVITVPAYFTDQQRQATKKAGELAGFVVERIINEPTAAAMAYGLDKLDDDHQFLVYDLGGGTFDVSVLELMGGILEVKASAGNKDLGGSDFDRLLLDYFSEKIIEESGLDPRKDLSACARLKEEAEKAKIKLSDQKQVQVSIPALMVKNNQPVAFEMEISRKEFIDLIDNLLKETLNSVKNVLEDAELLPDEIEQVILVGGSTRIPRVRELLRDFFDQEPHSEIDPDQAVAKGAGVQAGIKAGLLSDSGMIVTDVAPYSLGIEVLKDQGILGFKPGGFESIIDRNTTIPTSKTKVFTTTFDNQEEVKIKIYQGEGDWVEENHYLGEFILDGIPAKRAGEEKIAVSLNYNINGILDVTARSVSTDKEMQLTVQDAVDRKSEESYQESLERLENFQKEIAGMAGDAENNLQKIEYNPDLSEDIEESELDDFAAEGEDFKGLALEAENLKERAGELFVENENISRSEFKSMLKRLDQALASGEKDKLRQALEEVFEEILDLEMGE